MYKAKEFTKTCLKINDSLEGETLEQKMERITNNKEPIKDGSPLIYTERSEGVLAGYNVRTDRFEIAVEAMDKVHKANTAKRDNKATMKIVEDVNNEPTHGTENGTNN